MKSCHICIRQQASINELVNSIATTKGDRHVDHVADLVIKSIIATSKRRTKLESTSNHSKSKIICGFLSTVWLSTLPLTHKLRIHNVGAKIMDQNVSSLKNSRLPSTNLESLSRCCCGPNSKLMLSWSPNSPARRPTNWEAWLSLKMPMKLERKTVSDVLSSLLREIQPKHLLLPVLEWLAAITTVCSRWRVSCSM